MNHSGLQSQLNSLLVRVNYCEGDRLKYVDESAKSLELAVELGFDATDLKYVAHSTECQYELLEWSKAETAINEITTEIVNNYFERNQVTTVDVKNVVERYAKRHDINGFNFDDWLCELDHGMLSEELNDYFLD